MNYIIVYLEIEHLLNFLSQEEKGDFLDLLIEYGKNQKLPEIKNLKVLNVFNFMKGRLDTQFEKARIKAETAKKNGASGGRPKKPSNNSIKPKKTQLVFNEDFEELWSSYEPVRTRNGDVVAKGSKITALRAYQKALQKYTADEIHEGAMKYLKDCLEKNSLTCAVSTMLNQERFVFESYKTLNVK